jgi:hypothetical protein
MKGTTSTKVHRPGVRKIIAAATVFCFLGIVPFLAVTQDKGEIAGPVQPSGLTGVTGSPFNPLQIGLLHWYTANQTTTFSLFEGATPVSMVFDGANIWVTTANISLMAMRASDGAIVGGAGVGHGGHLTYDGANVWVANGNGVTKVRASDNAILGTFLASGGELAFDGANIWVTNGNGVTKLRASDGRNLGTFPVGNGPSGIAFDGTNIWVTYGDWVANGSGVMKLRASDGANLGAFPAGNGPSGVAFDGTDVWVVNTDDSTVTKLRASDGIQLGTFALSLQPSGALAFDGANLWVGGDIPGGEGVTKVRASDGAILGVFGTEFIGYVGGAVFDGAHIWVAVQTDCCQPNAPPKLTKF